MKPTYIKKCIKKNVQTVWLSGDDKTHQPKSGYLSLPNAQPSKPPRKTSSWTHTSCGVSMAPPSAPGAGHQIQKHNAGSQVHADSSSKNRAEKLVSLG